MKNNLPHGPEFTNLSESIATRQNYLKKMFSFDLYRGNPSLKPIVIRGENDKWSENNPSQTTYKSEVSRFIADFIDAITSSPAKPNFPNIDSYESLKSILRTINIWLDKVENAHQSKDDSEFPTAWKILGKINQKHIWDYSRPEIVKVLDNISNPISNYEITLCSVTQILTFCYYLMHRCGFTVIYPNNEDRAFDMFQSLNATGTPLTALETFKPLVVNAADVMDGYQGSLLEYYYNDVDNMFKHITTAAAKNTLTNDYLTTLAVVIDGTKLPSQFSKQRIWLTQEFDKCNSINEKQEFIRRMSDLANYWNYVLGFNPKQDQYIYLTDKPINNSFLDQDAKEAALCTIYLKSSGHSMANTILSRFYSRVLRKEHGADVAFIKACKAVAAFFTLWRSALPNKDLDDVYRKLLTDHLSWKKGDSEVNIKSLRELLKRELINKGIGSKQEWIIKAKQDLRYDSAKTVCKFVLFVVAHDTVPDTVPGLMIIGAMKSAPHLLPEFWDSPDFKTIEHIAPQNRSQNSGWDDDIYLNSDYQRIGNLILLPVKVNSAAGNKGWFEKWLYYQFLAEKTIAGQDRVKKIAQSKGISLDQTKAIKALIEAGHQDHIQSIVSIGGNRNWNRDLITARTERICDILWDRMMAWLE